MKIDTLFIANVLFLVALVAGANYMQTISTTDTHQGGDVAAAHNQNTVPVTDTSGWQVSTTTASAGVDTKSATVQPASAPKPAIKPSIRRLYNEDND